MTVKKNIMIDDWKIECEIHYKNIKNCYLRIRDGKIIISASRYYSEKQIDAFIYKNRAMIIQQLSSYHQRVSYQDHGYVEVFGNRYELIIKDLKIRRCVMHEHDIYVYDRHIQPVLDNFLTGLLLNYIEKKVQYYISSDFHRPMPEITIRKMKSRWGSCFYLKNKITFNFSLIFLPQELIDYVIIHELCHFIEPNHSARFYAEIEKCLPEYRLREKQLKETVI